MAAKKRQKRQPTRPTTRIERHTERIVERPVERVIERPVYRESSDQGGGVSGSNMTTYLLIGVVAVGGYLGYRWWSSTVKCPACGAKTYTVTATDETGKLYHLKCTVCGYEWTEPFDRGFLKQKVNPEGALA